jgi:hypothetical protein
MFNKIKLIREFKIFLFTIASIMILGSQSPAQEETLIGNGEISHGGFGGPVIKYTQIKDEFALMVGGRGGWILNHSFVIGLGGYALVNNIRANIPQAANYPQPSINFDYGGLELEYVFRPDRLIHSSVNMLIGGGSVSYKDELWNDRSERDFGSEVFFVFEPSGNIEINITNFFRLNAGISYRFISGIDLLELKNKDLSGLSATLTFKFGKF